MAIKLTILACLMAAAHADVISNSLSLNLNKFVKGRILGGHDADPGQFPYQVSLQIGFPPKAPLMHFCGGSIINEQWILTAAHCVEAADELLQKIPFLTFVVKAGKHDLAFMEDTEQTSLVKKYFRHKDYIGSNQVGPNDIGLLQLKNPFNLNRRVSKIRLPQKNSEPTGKSSLSGWGAMDNDTVDPKMPHILQTVELPIIDLETCNKAVNEIIKEEGVEEEIQAVDGTNICTGPLVGGTSSCNGDSGGPLMTVNQDGQKEIVGIVSWGMVPCGRKGGPSVFVRVAAFIDWIEDIMSKA
ncbi:hypothetical protein QAD02_006941 [Eretmocerus hayati]|uniref:Uncharacterized protein n=1 Tax=Eretmocerus hayati TaxID=131215 RepID=A0ACC2N2I5_9HYME|nr:hypothetical protein QAD02_006941 [Eretmocerus hayati]